jgi:hypothetical protein
VRGLEFNASAVHLLASGGAEGGLCIWDVTNTASPTEYPALKARCRIKPLSVAHVRAQCAALRTSPGHCVITMSSMKASQLFLVMQLFVKAGA